MNNLGTYLFAAPSDRTLRARVDSYEEGMLKAEFVPIEVGAHCINVTIGDVLLLGSPFACTVYDIRQIYISKLHRGVVGKPYEFEGNFCIQWLYEILSLVYENILQY